MNEVAEYVEIHRHPEPKSFISRWIFSLDHKVIGIQYVMLAVVAVFIGMALSLLIRLRLVWPEQAVPLLGDLFPVGAPDGIMTPEFYLSMLTMHGTMMVFMVLTTAPQGGFGNYVLPIQIGANDMAFPRLNMLSFWTTFLSFCALMMAFFVEGGAPISGWTAYPPLSALDAAVIAGTGQDWWIISIALFCVASLLGALNFIVTTLELRAKGLTMMRLPLTVWTWFVTAILGLLAFGVLLAAGVLLLLDRNLGTSFFIPAGLVINDQLIDRSGGSPILWQHLFWFFGHPEVYVVLLPAMGIVAEIMAVFARKKLFGYKTILYSVFATGILSFVVWAHHQFIAGIDPRMANLFTVTTLIISVPIAELCFVYIATLYGASITFSTPMLWALAFMAEFLIGGVTGIFLGASGLDVYYHDTYFVVAHFHYTFVPIAIIGFYAGITYWFPKMFGRMLNEYWGKVHFWGTIIPFNFIFIPLFILGAAGQHRRISGYVHFPDLYTQDLQNLRIIATVSLIAMLAFQVVFIVNMVYSWFRGKKAEINPWKANTLEWTVPSPPPHGNFAEFPTVYRGPYEYSHPDREVDYWPQNEPGPDPAKSRK